MTQFLNRILNKMFFACLLVFIGFTLAGCGQREHIRLAQQKQAQQANHLLPVSHAPICYGVSDARCAYEMSK
jgi:hypothetical protein